MYDGLVIIGREAFVPLPKLYFGNCLKKQKNLRGFSPQANYTDRVTAACRRN
jgi:hypothetical protein